MVWERVEIKLRTVWRKNTRIASSLTRWHKNLFPFRNYTKNVHKISTFPYLFHLQTVKQLNPAKEINQIYPYNRFSYRYSVVVIRDTCPGYHRRLMISGPADDCCHTPDVIFCIFVVPTANQLISYRKARVQRIILKIELKKHGLLLKI